MLVLKFAPKADETVDDFAATVVLDERTAGGKNADTTGETLTGDYVQDIEAALRRDTRR